jgi:uncharacterized membrane protein YgcG
MSFDPKNVNVDDEQFDEGEFESEFCGPGYGVFAFGRMSKGKSKGDEIQYTVRFVCVGPDAGHEDECAGVGKDLLEVFTVSEKGVKFLVQALRAFGAKGAIDVTDAKAVGEIFAGCVAVARCYSDPMLDRDKNPIHDKYGNPKSKTRVGRWSTWDGKPEQIPEKFPQIDAAIEAAEKRHGAYLERQKARQNGGNGGGSNRWSRGGGSSGGYASKGGQGAKSKDDIPF